MGLPTVSISAAAASTGRCGRWIEAGRGRIFDPEFKEIRLLIKTTCAADISLRLNKIWLLASTESVEKLKTFPFTFLCVYHLVVVIFLLFPMDVYMT